MHSLVASDPLPVAGIALAPFDDLGGLLVAVMGDQGRQDGGSNEHAMEAACRARLADITAARPRTAIVDQLRDDARARNIELWWDYTHYRGVVAREIEADIAAALRAL